MFLMVEAVKQLPRRVRDRQVPNGQDRVRRYGGWFSSASTLLLGVE